jgi:hypothetical protein
MLISRLSCLAAELPAARYNAAKRMPLNRIIALAAAALVAQAAVTTGPEIGQAIPAFAMPDQAGTVQTLKSVMGPKGALLVFYRSADW